MVETETFRSIALAFKEVTEQPHFEKTSFRVRKKIFATVEATQRKAVLNLPEIDQSVFCLMGTIFQAVPGAWGKKGWTEVDLEEVPYEILQDALTIAFCTVAPPSLGKNYLNNET